MVSRTAEEARVVQMTNQIDRFEQEFERLAAAYDAYGTADTGFEGAFRTDAGNRGQARGQDRG
jgi:hypothetical protein